MMNPYRWLSGQDADEQELGLIACVPPYMNHLRSEFATLVATLPPQNDPRNAAALELARTILAKPEKELRWGDVHTLETIILRLQPLDLVKRRAWGLRGRYRTAVGDEVYMAYERSRPPDPADPNIAEGELRDDLELLLADFHWMYAIHPLRESARTRIIQVVLRQMFIFTVIVALFVFFDLFAAYRGYHPFVSLFPLILLTGAFGAFVSLVQRVQSIPSAGDTILNVLNIKSGRSGFLLAPLSGALFALLAYLLFMSGFVKGDLFPSILYDPKELALRDPILDIPVSFNSFAYWMMPKSPTDFAKLLIWCFIAGFAERLIPDALNRLIARKLEGYVETMVAGPPPPDDKAGADAEAARAAEAAKKAADDKAAAAATAAARKEEADKEVADEKANAVAAAAARKEESDKAVADKTVGADEQVAADAQKQSAAEHAAADTEAARRVAEAEKRSATEHAAADVEAAQRVAEADKRVVDVQVKPVQPAETTTEAAPAQSAETSKPPTVTPGPKPADTAQPPTVPPEPKPADTAQPPTGSPTPKSKDGS